ncbi:MAG: Uma2 family endonuclease, partial [Nostoc sp.]
EVELGLCLWEGAYEGKRDVWLRWCDATGNMIPTGAERAEQERLRAEQEHLRAEQERLRAEQERLRAEQEREAKETALQRAERLAAQLRALGVEPEV